MCEEKAVWTFSYKEDQSFDWSFLYVRIDRLATMKGVTMSKYLTYEERLEIQQKINFLLERLLSALVRTEPLFQRR